MENKAFSGLEMITPIRGRKFVGLLMQHFFTYDYKCYPDRGRKSSLDFAYSMKDI